MRKILSNTLFLFILLQSLAYAGYWRAEDTYYKFDFSAYPEYTALQGDWEVTDILPEKILNYTFENKCEDFFAESGEWEFKDGMYVQNEIGISATTKTMLADNYKEFLIEFDIIPYSDENTVMIYFGRGNDKISSAEINSYQSKFIINGEEFVGEGGILKDTKYHIGLKYYNDTLELSLDDRIVLSKTNISKLSGSVGIGTWNSSIAFDDFSVSNPSFSGFGKILKSEGNAMLLFPQLEAEKFVFESEIASCDIYGGEIGVVVFGQSNGDGYYIGINKNSIFLKDKKTILKKEIFKPQSKKLYKISVICDEYGIKVSVDGEDVLSYATETKKGVCGFFAKNTDIQVKSVEMSLLKNISPMIQSIGNTKYYIDAENGNDFNDGTSPKTAWKTLDRAEQCNFKEGDYLLLKCGNTFAGTLSLKKISGDFAISSYGDGEKPKISSCITGIDIDECTDITISNINIEMKNYTGEGYGIIAKNSENILVSDCILKCDTFGGKTYAADGKDITLKNCVADGFDVNSVTYDGNEIISDGEEIKTHWAYKYMKRLKNSGIISEYRPDDIVTRAEFASMITSALNLNESEYRGIFSDVTAEDWFAAKLQTLSDYRFLPLEMTPKGHMSPNDGLLREEAAVIAALAASADNYELCNFSDMNKASKWAEKYIYAVVKIGIMKGRDDGSFCPNDTVTRAEAAVILTKLTEGIVK